MSSCRVSARARPRSRTRVAPATGPTCPFPLLHGRWPVRVEGLPRPAGGRRSLSTRRRRHRRHRRPAILAQDRGDELTFQPPNVDISGCTTKECRFTATWVLMVAMPGTTWTRGEIPFREPRAAFLVAAIDQGTTSSRCILFDHDGRPVASHQLEHRQITRGPAGSSMTPTRSSSECVPAWASRWATECRCHGPRRGWHQQPARDDRGLGPRHGSAGPSGDRLAGHPHRRCRRPNRRPGSVPCEDRAARLDLLECFEAALDPRPGRSRSLGTRVRDDRYMAALAAHRRRRWRRPRDRRDEREPDDADGPATLEWDEPTTADRYPETSSPRSADRARSMALASVTSRACRSPASSATSMRRCSGDVLEAGEAKYRTARRFHADAYGHHARSAVRTG